jgi:N-methylhydantoinase B
MRAEIAKLPNGTWQFTDYLDGLGDEPEPITLKVAVSIDRDRMIIDWAGSSPQVRGAINCPLPFTKAACYCVVKCLVEEPIPDFEGFMRPIEIRAPERTVVNASAPAACAARAIIGWRALDVLFGAFAQIAPDRIPAAGEGGVSFPVISGSQQGKSFICSETLAGAWGALPDRDGVYGIPNPGGNMTNQPVEMIETLFPVEVTRYALVENSGGPGRHRGGFAFVREYRLHGEEASVVMRSDRRRFLPYGLGGGCPGTPSWNIVNPGASQDIVPVMPMSTVPLARGDVFCHISAGGGGHGDPLERSPEAVAADVAEELITRDYARAVYGVIIDDKGRPDAAATARTRALLHAQPADGDEARPAYLEIFHRQLGIEEFALVGERELKV